MLSRSESTTARGLISSVFRKKEPKAVKDLYTSSDDDDNDEETEHDEKEQEHETEELAAAVKREEEANANAEEEEEASAAQQRPISRSSSRLSRSSSRSSRSSRRHKKSSRSSHHVPNHLSANSLALKIEGGSNRTTGEDQPDEDRSVATSASRRSARGGGGRHRLSSRNQAMNRSTDSFLGLLDNGEGGGEGDEPEEDPLDISTKSATGVQRNRSRRVGERLRSRRQRSDRFLLGNESTAAEKKSPSSPRKVPSRRHQSARVERGQMPLSDDKTKEATPTTASADGEEEPSTKRSSDPNSRSRSRPRRAQSHAAGRNGISRTSQTDQLSGSGNNTKPSESKSSTHDKPRRSRSKSATRSSQANGTRSRSKSAARAVAGNSRHRTRSRSVGSRQHQSQRRGDSVDRKKHNAQRSKATTTKPPGDSEKKASHQTNRKTRTSTRQGERRNRHKSSTTKTKESPEVPIDGIPVIPSPDRIDDGSKMDNSASAARGMDVSMKADNNSSLSSIRGIDNSTRMDGNASASAMESSFKMENNASGTVDALGAMDHSIRPGNNNNASESSIGAAMENSVNMDTGNASATIAGENSQTEGLVAPMDTSGTLEGSINFENSEQQVPPSNASPSTLSDSIVLDETDGRGPRLGDKPLLPHGGMEDSINLEKDDGRLMVAGGTRFYKEDAGASSDLSSNESTLSKTLGSSSSSSDDSYNESRKFSMAEVLQFDPTQAGLVQRVKQISSDKTGYEINGHSGQIGEIVDSVNNFQETNKHAPLFNLLDDNPETGDLIENEKPASPIGRRRRKNRFGLRRTKSQCSDDADQDNDKDVQAISRGHPEDTYPDSLGYNGPEPSELLSPTQTKEKKKAMYNELLERFRSKGRSRSNGSENTGGSQDSVKEEHMTDSPRRSEEPAPDLTLLSPTPRDRKKKLYDILDDNDNDEEPFSEQQTPNNNTREKRRTLAKKASGYLQKMLNSSASNMPEGGEDDTKSMASSASNRSGKKSLKRMFSASAKNKKNRGQLLDSASVASSLADQELLYDEILKAK